MNVHATFGGVISTKRKEKGLHQKELAGRILREDGQSISPQYLNDIEHDRRSPSSDLMIKQIAEILDLPPDYLHYLAGKFPSESLDRTASPEQVQEAMYAFRQTLQKYSVKK
jgi:transcriptional regulator with XRE-family HTH domain